MRTRRSGKVSQNDKNSEINEKLKEIEAKEKQLKVREGQLELKNKKITDRCRDLEADKEKLALREKQFEEKWRELELYTVEVEEDRDKATDQLRELESRDAQLKERMQEIEQIWRKCEADKKKLEEKQLGGGLDGFDFVRNKEFESIKSKITADWKKLEERIHDMDQKEKNLDMRTKSLDLLSMDLARKYQEFGAQKSKIKADSKELEERVKGFDLRSMNVEMEHTELEKKIEAEWKKLDERICAVDHRERELDWGLTDLEKERKELESTKRKLEADRKKLEDRFCEMNHRENKLDGGREVLEMGNKDLCRQRKELESDKKKVEADRKKLDEQLHEFELNYKKSDETVKELKLGRRDLEDEFIKLESDKQEINVDRQKLDGQFRELEIKFKKVEVNNQEFELSKRELREQLEQVKLKENWLDMLPREIELKQNKYEDLCKEIVMNGKTLQIFLNECWRDHEKTHNGVYVLLRLSQDPAMLVLDALEGFFPPHLRKGDVEFAAHIVQRSCIMLLEQLLKISHVLKLRPEIKNEARRLSSDWIIRLKADGEHFTEILGFLLVIANYGLTSNFDVDEIFKYVKIVAHCEQVPNLCAVLGMADRIPGLIQDLVERKQHLVAIRYAFYFNLIEKFPVDSLLKDHMETSKIESAAIIEGGNNSLESQATTRKVADLRAAISCIENYNISSEYSPANLRQLITSLEKHETEQTELAVSGYTGVKKITVDVPLTATTESTFEACTMAQEGPQRQQTGTDFSGAAIPRNDFPDGLDDVSSIGSDYQRQAVISTEDPLPKRIKLSDGKNTSTENADSKLEEEEVCGSQKDLRVLLCQNLDFSLMQDKVVEILRSSSDPARCVFDAMKLCFLPTYSSSCEGVIECCEAENPINWCISLLKELKGVPYAIEDSTIVEAGEFAMSWNIILQGKKGGPNPMKIACFLLFLDAYQLNSPIRAKEACHLINLLRCSKQLHDFFAQIGMPEFLPDFIKSLIATNKWLQAIRYIHALDLRDRFPITALIDNHLAHWNKIADDRYKGPNVSDHLQMKGRSMRLCTVRSVLRLVRHCKLESEYPIKQLEETLNVLKEAETGAGGHAASSASTASSSRKRSFPKSPSNQRCKRDQFRSRGRSHGSVWDNEPPFQDNCYGMAGFAPHLPPPPHPWWGGFHPPLPPPPPLPNHFDNHVGNYYDHGYGGDGNWSGGWNPPHGPYHGFQ